jgi:hypothetical protein
MAKVVQRWLTKEEREIAKKNGIGRSTLHSRVYLWGYDIERAITEPPKKSSIIDGYREKCRENGVSDSLFHYRVNSGWNKEDASTKPPEKRDYAHGGVCTVEGCGNKHRAKGFCSTHYMKFGRKK